MHFLFVTNSTLDFKSTQSFFISSIRDDDDDDDKQENEVDENDSYPSGRASSFLISFSLSINSNDLIAFKQIFFIKYEKYTFFF